MRLSMLQEALPLSTAKEYGWSSRDSSYSYDDIFDRFSKYARKNTGNPMRLYFPMKPETVYNIGDGDLAGFYWVLTALETLDLNWVLGEEQMMTKLFGWKTSTKMKTIGSHAKDMRHFMFISGNLDPYSVDNPETQSYSSDKLYREPRRLQILKDYKKGIIELAGVRYRIGKLLDMAIKYLNQPTEVILSDYDENTDILTNTIERARKMVSLCRLDVLDAKSEFTHDKFREGHSSKEQMYMVLSRHPYDIAGASTGRGWTSCIDLDGGIESCNVDGYARYGLIAYQIKDGDWNIKNPMGRVLIMPFHKNGDPDAPYVLKSLSEYGTVTGSFKNTIRKLLKVVNRNATSGTYSNPKNWKNIQYGGTIEHR